MEQPIQNPKSKVQNRAERKSRYAAIKIRWRQLRPDLAKTDEERGALLDFAVAELGIAAIGSLTDLTMTQLNRVMVALGNELAAPRLPGASVPIAASSREGAGSTAEITHLASKEEQWLIEQLFEYADWSEFYRERFLEKHYGKKSPAMLNRRQARGCITALLRSAAYRDLKFGKPDTTHPSPQQIRVRIGEIKKIIARRAVESSQQTAE